MSHLEYELMVVGQRYRVQYEADISELAFVATLQAHFYTGEFDPIADEEISAFPGCRTYWDNGVVLDTMHDPDVTHIEDQP